MFDYGNILEELSVIKCLPAEEKEKRNLYGRTRAAGEPNRPLRISTQVGLQMQDNNAKFIKVRYS